MRAGCSTHRRRFTPDLVGVVSWASVPELGERLLAPNVAPLRTGERRLMLAVLEDAFDCWMKYSRIPGYAAERLAHLEQRWFMHGESGDISFEMVCTMLNLDMDAVRNAVVKRVERR